MAAMDGSKPTLLDKLQTELDPVELTDAELVDAKNENQGLGDNELRNQISRLKMVTLPMPDGGLKKRKRCQLLEAELKRRAAVSKGWLHSVSATFAAYSTHKVSLSVLPVRLRRTELKLQQSVASRNNSPAAQ